MPYDSEDWHVVGRVAWGVFFGLLMFSIVALVVGIGVLAVLFAIGKSLV